MLCQYSPVITSTRTLGTHRYFRGSARFGWCAAGWQQEGLSWTERTECGRGASNVLKKACFLKGRCLCSGCAAALQLTEVLHVDRSCVDSLRPHTLVRAQEVVPSHQVSTYFIYYLISVVISCGAVWVGGQATSKYSYHCHARAPKRSQSWPPLRQARVFNSPRLRFMQAPARKCLRILSCSPSVSH
jgi:hypothetical protein